MSKKLLAAAALIAATFAPAAFAGVIASATTTVTVAGQGYNHAFNLSGPAQSNVVLSINAKGDYGFNFDGFNEYLNFYIDGVQLAHWSSSNGGPSGVVTNVENYDYTMTGNISISAAQWAQFAADNVLHVTWQNTGMVDAYPDVAGADYVSFSIEGSNAAAEVPEPGSLALLGLGRAGFGLARRRKAYAWAGAARFPLACLVQCGHEHLQPQPARKKALFRSGCRQPDHPSLAGQPAR